MPTSHANIATKHASRYLQQLCKHWSHRFSVEFTVERGQIDLGDGKSVMLGAAPTELSVRVEASDQSELPRLEKVVEDHIARFAFREDLTFNWTNGSVGLA